MLSLKPVLEESEDWLVGSYMVCFEFIGDLLSGGKIKSSVTCLEEMINEREGLFRLDF